MEDNWFLKMKFKVGDIVTTDRRGKVGSFKITVASRNDGYSGIILDAEGYGHERHYIEASVMEMYYKKRIFYNKIWSELNA